jgi:hypothetical protein
MKFGCSPGDSGAVSLLCLCGVTDLRDGLRLGPNLSSRIFLVELGTVGLGILQGRTIIDPFRGNFAAPVEV